MNNQQAINLLKGLEQSLDDYCELNNEGKAAYDTLEEWSNGRGDEE